MMSALFHPIVDMELLFFGVLGVGSLLSWLHDHFFGGED